MAEHNPYRYTSAADAYAQPAAASSSPHQPISSSDPNQVSSPPIAGTGAYETHLVNSQGYAQTKNYDDQHDHQAQADHDDEEEDDEGWNVYDDFNMTRPIAHRSSTSGLTHPQQEYWDASKPSLVDTPYSDYPNHRKSLLPSEAFGFDVRNADPRHSIIQHNTAIPNTNRPISGVGPAHADATTGIELITVPALGTEYTKEELKDMTRVNKRKRKRTARKKKWHMWVSGDDHICGWLSPRVAVFLAFFFFAALAVLLYFVIPRVPTIGYLSTNPVVAIPNGASMQVNHSPTNFSMQMGFNLRADNTGGWITSKASNLQMEVTDINTFKKVGTGSMKSVNFAGRKRTEFQFPVQFAYVSLNTSGDQTWQDFYQACGPNIQGETRPTLNLALKLTMSISGLVGRKTAYTSIGNIVCPFTLQSYQ